MRHFRVRSFDELQHYKDRSPPWIKLYGKMLDDYDVASLPDASKWHLVAIFLLASRTGNRIPYDEIWVGNKIGARDKVDLALLQERGFIEEIQEASVSGADRKQVASKTLDQRREEGEERREDRRAREAEKPKAAEPLRADDPALEGEDFPLLWLGDESSADRQLGWLGAIVDELPERDRKPVTDFTRMAVAGKPLSEAQAGLLETLFQRHKAAIVAESNRRIGRRFPGLDAAAAHPVHGKAINRAMAARDDAEIDRLRKLVAEDLTPPGFLRRAAQPSDEATAIDAHYREITARRTA